MTLYDGHCWDDNDTTIVKQLCIHKAASVVCAGVRCIVKLFANRTTQDAGLDALFQCLQADRLKELNSVRRSSANGESFTAMDGNIET